MMRGWQELITEIYSLEVLPSSINKYIQVIANELSCEGIILWELPKDSLDFYTVANWFIDNEQFFVHNLPRQGSLTGRAVEEFVIKFSNNINNDPAIYRNTAFWNNYKFMSFATFPVQLKGGNSGAINLYSKKELFFNEFDFDYAYSLIKLLPNFLQALSDRVTYKLISEIDIIFNSLNHNLEKNVLSKYFIIQQFEKLIFLLADMFKCFEVSLFLVDPFEDIEQYKLVSTTFKPVHNRPSYRASEKNGLTGWILQHKRAVVISDLKYFDDNIENIRKTYPNLTWGSKYDIASAVANHLEINNNNAKIQLQPLSFIGVPIMFGNTIFGVLRCCAALESPYFFGQNEHDRLLLVANRIAQSWSNWIQRKTIENENQAWTRAVALASIFDKKVLQELHKESPSENQLFTQILTQIPKLISDAGSLDIRLIDTKKNELYFAYVYGDEWDADSAIDPEQRKINKKFSLHGSPPTSAGAKVYRDKKALMYDFGERMHYYDVTFTSTKKIIVAPLMAGERVFGVLDVRSNSPRKFDITALPIVKLLARQLAVYYSLILTINELKEVKRQQVQTFQDFSHQFRNPINQAAKWARSSLEKEKNKLDYGSIKNLNVLSGLINKAKRVSNNIKIFSDLAANKSLYLGKEYLHGDKILKVIIEISIDNKILIPPYKALDIVVDKMAYDSIRNYIFELDLNLFEQAINALLDNAVKYSYPESTISVTTKVSKKGSLLVIITNVGIKISKEETFTLKQRGVRSDLASAVTGEGGGIGLWVVDNIMKAHGGELVINPTNEAGENVFMLIFPNKKEVK